MIINWLVGLGAPFGLILLLGFIADLIGPPADGIFFPLTFTAVVVGTAIWASIDTRRLNFSEYQINFPSSRTPAFLLVAFIWFVGCPWFIATWLGIVRGTIAEKSAGAQPWPEPKAIRKSDE